MGAGVYAHTAPRRCALCLPFLHTPPPPPFTRPFRPLARSPLLCECMHPFSTRRYSTRALPVRKIQYPPALHTDTTLVTLGEASCATLSVCSLANMAALIFADDDEPPRVRPLVHTRDRDAMPAGPGASCAFQRVQNHTLSYQAHDTP